MVPSVGGRFLYLAMVNLILELLLEIEFEDRAFFYVGEDAEEALPVGLKVFSVIVFD